MLLRYGADLHVCYASLLTGWDPAVLLQSAAVFAAYVEGKGLVASPPARLPGMHAGSDCWLCQCGCKYVRTCKAPYPKPVPNADDGFASRGENLGMASA